MVRVLIYHKAKDPEKLMAVIRDVRNEAMKRRGYITGETLVSTDDPADVIVITTWQTLKDWEAWDTSDQRQELNKKINLLLEEPYVVRTYQHYLVREDRVWSTM